MIPDFVSRQSIWARSCLAVAVGWALCGTHCVLAEDDPPKPAKAKWSPFGRTAQDDMKITLPNAGSRMVKLGYLQATWKKVLDDLADATGTTVVADKYPTRTFSRWDRREHTVDEAIKILNKELEPLGYRILLKKEHLLLIDVPSSRPEYPRPVVTADNRVVLDPENDRANADASDDEPASGERAGARKRRPRAADPKLQMIVQASGEDDADLALDDERDIPPEPQEVVRAVKLVEHDAVSLARILYVGFKPHADLITNGPNGLNAFRVFHPAAKGKPGGDRKPQAVRFVVGIDRDRNQLIVQAAPAEAESVAKLIETLDQTPDRLRSAIRPVTVPKNADKIADALQPELTRIADEGAKVRRQSQGQPKARRAALYRDGVEPGDEPDQRLAQQEAAQPQRGAAEASAPAKPPAAKAGAEPGEKHDDSTVEGLRGDVSVEAMSDLGVLIIRGSQQDVEAVMAIIKEIERVSTGATPEVQLHRLQHVNSESLAALMNNVYDKLNTARTRSAQGAQRGPSISIIPIVKPNAILILAPLDDLENVVGLAEDLDQPVDPETEFEVFRLKHAIPSQVVDTVQEMYPSGGQAQQQQQAAGLVPRVRIIANVRTNSVIVQARPRDMKEVAHLIEGLDASDSDSISKLKIFPLKNATAEELATTLQQAISSVLSPSSSGSSGQGGGGGGGGGSGDASELRGVKSSIIEFLAGDDAESRELRSGILSDIRISGDSRTNSLVVTAPEASMNLIAELVKQLDRPAAAVAEIKVFSLKNSDANTMVALLQRLFGVQQQAQGQGGAAGGAGGQAAGAAMNVLIEGAEDASSNLIPMRFSVDVRTNSIVAIGGGEALRVVEAVLLSLDLSDIRQRQTAIYRLKNTPAVDVAAAINLFLSNQRQVNQSEAGLVSPFEQLEREVVVVPEAVSNTLLISATSRFFDEIQGLVVKLDSAPRQVVIQAMLVEVTLDNTDEFGMELGLQDSVLFNRSFSPAPTILTTTTLNTSGQSVQTQNVFSQTSNPGFLFNNGQPLGNNTNPALNPAAIGSQALSSFNVGRINNDLGYGGLVLSAGSESVNFLLRALAARRRIDILSRPQIRTLDNQSARIMVGAQFPRVNGFQPNTITGVATPLIQQTPIGVILTVTPRVTPEQTVVMDVIAEKSAIQSGNGVQLIANANGTVLTSPIIDVTFAQTTLSVGNGQTVVMGGMITKTDDVTHRKVPILGDIPILGLGFRYDLSHIRRTELLMFLTPRVLTNDAESELMKRVETQRIHYIESEVEQLHGPILGVPGPEVEPPPGFETRAADNLANPEDDPNCPTTIMPGEPVQLPPVTYPNTNYQPPTDLPPAPGDVGDAASRSNRTPTTITQVAATSDAESPRAGSKSAANAASRKKKPKRSIFGGSQP